MPIADPRQAKKSTTMEKQDFIDFITTFDLEKKKDGLEWNG